MVASGDLGEEEMDDIMKKSHDYGSADMDRGGSAGFKIDSKM
jgi:hypothetical protein